MRLPHNFGSSTHTTAMMKTGRLEESEPIPSHPGALRVHDASAQKRSSGAIYRRAASLQPFSGKLTPVLWRVRGDTMKSINIHVNLPLID